MNNLPLCKDCKWCSTKLFYGYEFAKCLNPQNPNNLKGNNLVSGITHKTASYCETSRNYDLCGIEGKLWEAKQ